MPVSRSWTDKDLISAVNSSTSYRMVIKKLGLVPAGGNYKHIVKTIDELKLSTKHFTGKGWNKGWKFDPRAPAKPLEELLINGSSVQSNKLKVRLFKEGLKKPKCELCGWAQVSQDGRIPVELDHVNGKSKDNRLDNLRILCPNCHSLQATHRGRNKKVRLKYK
ncbi:HNH endonuclease [Candidatus Saccharibacteria bacterium]|nr:HNH endonuclease [Candidatus Saccharibacteria bacterium]